MACGCLSRHLEYQILNLDVRREETPRWRWRRRRELWNRTCVLYLVLHAAYEAERSS